ncbi:astacin-like metalloendopeptidase [Hyla sarda]|uniref:astacin-like metalloendopeptidase n=1 Tax=Hyla sarda TaxID=327740 RepID=UPI0024C2B47A|nr:astacin-like metalloendopeptidase [Hyla sarda]
MQALSLGFPCIRKGKGVVLHELLHMIGFWHEHSRKDREQFVEIVWSAIDEKYLRNFCLYDTTNMIVKYDYGSLLQYSNVAFSKSGAQTIKPKDPSATIGQRTKLSASDIQRVNKLYQCPQYVPSPDDNDIVVVPDTLSGDATCPEPGMTGLLDKPLVNILSLNQEQDPVSPPQSEESKTGQDTLHSSGPESAADVNSLLKTEVNGFVHSVTKELPHVTTDLTIPNGNATVESVQGTIAPESMHYPSTVSIAHRSTEQPPTEPPKRTAARESIHEDNPTVVNTHKNTEHLPSDHSPAVTTISAVGSSVTNSELIFRGTTQSAPELVFNFTATPQASINPEEKGTEHSTKEAIPKIHSCHRTMTASAISEGSSTEAMLPTSIYMPKRTTSTVDIMEGHTILQTSANYQSSAKQEQTTTEDTWISSGSGDTVNAYGEDYELVKGNLPKVVRKRSLAWKTLGSWSEHHPRPIYGYKLTHSYEIRNSSLIIEPSCGFAHGLCGWKQSSEDDLDWRLGWRNLNANVGPSGPEGFHLSLKHSAGKRVYGQKASLLRPVGQLSNCISFWYGSRHSVKGTLNVYIASSGGEKTLLWSSDGQDHAKWTKAQIMLPPPLLHNHAQVVLEGVLGPSYKSNIAIDDLYVGQCS